MWRMHGERICWGIKMLEEGGGGVKVLKLYNWMNIRHHFHWHPRWCINWGKNWPPPLLLEMITLEINAMVTKVYSHQTRKVATKLLKKLGQKLFALIEAKIVWSSNWRRVLFCHESGKTGKWEVTRRGNATLSWMVLPSQLQCNREWPISKI